MKKSDGKYSEFNPMKLLRKLFTLPIVIYRKIISPLKPCCCRYTPSCSQYAIQAVMVHGILRGTILSVWRILRCNPYGGFGEDPVPEYGVFPTEKLFINIKRKIKTIRIQHRDKESRDGCFRPEGSEKSEAAVEIERNGHKK